VGRGKRVERVEIAPVLTNCSISLSYGGFVVLGAGFTLSTLFFVKEKYIQKRSINLLKHLHCLFFSFWVEIGKVFEKSGGTSGASDV